MRVVFPDDSGPKISITRPRGRPPTPSARSIANEPVGMISICLKARASPRRMMLPSPYALVIEEMAASRSRWRTAESLAVSVALFSTEPLSLFFSTVLGGIHVPMVKPTLWTLENRPPLSNGFVNELTYHSFSFTSLASLRFPLRRRTRSSGRACSETPREIRFGSRWFWQKIY